MEAIKLLPVSSVKLLAGTIENVSVTGKISGGSGSTIGGIVGTDDTGVIQNAYSAATVMGGDGAKNVGGVIGYFAGECGPECLGQLTSSFSVGPVSGGAGASVGGVIGENSGAQILNSYALGPCQRRQQFFRRRRGGHTICLLGK
ncbi:MAG: hypothetical protein WDM89_07995 [Rhizomicrobium sp.]